MYICYLLHAVKIQTLDTGLKSHFSSRAEVFLWKCAKMMFFLHNHTVVGRVKPKKGIQRTLADLYASEHKVLHNKPLELVHKK